MTYTFEIWMEKTNPISTTTSDERYSIYVVVMGEANLPAALALALQEAIDNYPDQKPHSVRIIEKTVCVVVSERMKGSKNEHD